MFSSLKEAQLKGHNSLKAADLRGTASESSAGKSVDLLVLAGILLFVCHPNLGVILDYFQETVNHLGSAEDISMFRKAKWIPY